MDQFDISRQQMVLSQIKPHHVHDEHVLSAFSTIPRHLFVPESQRGYAYRDGLLFLNKGEYLLSPATLARLLQEAQIQQNDDILLLNGTTGYTAALLMHLGGQVDIYETNEDFIKQSNENFNALSLSSYDFIASNPLDNKNFSKQYKIILIAGGIEKSPPFIFDRLMNEGKFIGIFCHLDVDKVVCLQRLGTNLQENVLFETKAPCLSGFNKEDVVDL